MKQLFSKKHLTTLISSFAAGTGIILACAGDWGPEYGTSSFTPEAFVSDDSYRPFFYSGTSFYYDIGYDTKHDNRFNDVNISDWLTYLGSGTRRTELEHLLQTATETAIDSAADFANGKTKSLPSGMKSFQLFKKLNTKTTSFLSYLSLAKKSEAFAVNNFEYSWEYDSKKKNTSFNAAPLNSKLLQEFTKTTDAFLKQRYWFQLERSYFFNGPSQKAIDLFENNEKSFPKNDMYYRTMAYAAGVYNKLKNFSKANYYYSRVFDSCTALRTVAHYSFNPQEQADWTATLALAANNDEKATLWQMLGIYYADEVRAMQEIYALNPRSEKLDLLLTRAINKTEQNFNDYNEGIQGSILAIKKDTVNSSLFALVTRVAQAGNTSQPWKWHTALGYLNMLKGNTEKAAAAYAQAEKKLPKEELAQSQLRLLKLINIIASATKADSKLEKTILPELEWLTGIKLEDGAFRHQSALSWVRQTLSNRYKTQKEYIKAVCFSNYQNFYVDNNNIEAMKTFLAKTNKTPYEALYAKLYPLTANNLVEYQAIALALHDNLEEAIAKMETLPATNTTLPGNPFNGRLQDCHDCDHEAAQKIKYTKLSLLKKMKEMEDKIKAGGAEVYTNAMLVANAFYNMTHYGNARAFYENQIIGSYHYSPFAIDQQFRSLLIDMSLPTKYYTQALNAAKTDEQKAKCYFMLAKCERNKYYNTNLYNKKEYHYGDRANLADYLAWDGFKSLKQYKTTKFYQEAIRECGYFRTWSQK
ncbi:hypothetical protein [Niastella populi]|uniref:Uncharacterized protein n=1 Tax=Niastella populi TaxID=550983 RepID=A0A1V9FJ70_9BACT|nr:hypothetical protein [Niastella populi]OQP58408.1 hypothetical protein A4R26_02825 [Niastella populi]